MITCSENGRNLSKAKLNSLSFGKFRGLWTKEWFYGKHETGLCVKCEKRLWIPNNDVVAYLKPQKLARILQRLAIFNIIPYRMQPQQNRTRCLNATYFSYNHSSPNKSANLPKRQAIAGQRTVGVLLVLNDAHNPINNLTIQITDPGKQNTVLPRNYTNNRRVISHNDGDVCSYHHGTPFWQYIPRGIMVGGLFCPICQILPVWFHYTVFPRLCCFRLTTVFENCHPDTLHNISRYKFAIVF